MRLFSDFLFLLNFAAWITLNVICWSLTGDTLGLVVLVGIMTFLIAWGGRREAVSASFDNLAQPEWSIITIKLKWQIQLVEL